MLDASLNALMLCLTCEQIDLPAKLLEYFLWSKKKQHQSTDAVESAVPAQSGIFSLANVTSFLLHFFRQFRRRSLFLLFFSTPINTGVDIVQKYCHFQNLATSFLLLCLTTPPDLSFLMPLQVSMTIQIRTEYWMDNKYVGILIVGASLP